MEPANTGAPAVFSSGIDSPVMRAWSTNEWPAMTVPSTGMRPPGFTSTASPTASASVSTSATPPPRRTDTARGKKSNRSPIARRPRDTVIPSSTSAINTNRVITSAVKNSEMAAAAMMAMAMDSSMVMRFEEVLHGLLEDPPATADQAQQTDWADPKVWFPQMPPDAGCRCRHECDAEHLSPLKCMVVISNLIVVGLANAVPMGRPDGSRLQGLLSRVRLSAHRSLLRLPARPLPLKTAGSVRTSVIRRRSTRAADRTAMHPRPLLY